MKKPQKTAQRPPAPRIPLLLAAALIATFLSSPAPAVDTLELVRRGQYKEAAEALVGEIEKNPRNAELRIQLAELYIMFQKYEAARKVLTDALEIEPDNPTIHTDLGIVYEQEGKPSKALLEQLRAAELSPDHPTAHNNLGHTYLSLGMPRKANESFRKAVLVNTNTLLDIKSKLGIRPGRSSAALNLTPDQASLLTFYFENIAYAYLGMDNREKALENLREALRYDPGNNVITQKIDQIERGAESIPEQVEEVPLTGDERLDRESTARTLLLNGNIHDSGALLQNMLSRGVESPSIRTAHGIVLQAIGDVEGAAEEYLRALELDPGNMPALANLGFISEYRGQFDKSIEYYTRALEIEPDNAMIHNNLGHVCELSGDHEKALAEYARALELQPDLAVAMQNLAGLYLTEDMLDQALEALGAALTLGPPSPAIYNNLAFIHHKQFNKAGAKEKLQEGLERHPGHKILERNLAFLSRPPGKPAPKRPKGGEHLLTEKGMAELKNEGPGQKEEKSPGAAREPEESVAPPETVETSPAEPLVDKPQQAAPGHDAAPELSSQRPVLPPAEISFARNETGAFPPKNLKVPLPEVEESHIPETAEMLSPLLSAADFPQEWKDKRGNIKGRFLFESGERKIWLAEPSAKLAEIVAEGKQPAISADGRRVATTQRVKRNLDIRLLALETGEAKSIVSSTEFKKDLAFSSDGRFLAFISAEGFYIENRLWVYSFDESAARKISEIGDVETFAWVPGAHKIVVFTSECPGTLGDEITTCLADVDADTGSAAWIEPAFRHEDTGEEIDLRHQRITSVAVSPATGELLLGSAGGLEAILALNHRTGTARYIEIEKPDGEPPTVRFPAWSPDGARIAFVHRGDIWVADSTGGAAYPAVWGHLISGRITWIQP